MEKNKILIYVLVISLLVNCYFVYRYCFVKPTIIIKDRIVEKPVEVIKIKTVWKVIEKPFVRPEGSIEAVLSMLEHSIPHLELEPLYLYKMADGTVEIPEYLGGTLRLDYLHWDLMAKLNAEVEYEERPLEFRFGLLGGLYYDSMLKTFTDINLMYLIWGMNIGAGLKTITLTKAIKSYSNTELDLGLGWYYNSGLAGIMGISFKL